MPEKKENISEEKIEFLLKNGFSEAVIFRCSKEMQEEMYFSTYKGKYKTAPYIKERNFKVKK